VSDNARGRVRRRLAAILVAGIGRLFPGGEVDRFAAQRRLLTDVFEPLIAEFGGNIFKRTEEGILVEFESVVETVRCAAELRDAVAAKNEKLPNEDQMAVRIGINLGDVITEAGDVFGDGVNIAARVAALAELGSVYVSAVVYDQVVDKLELEFEDLGPRQLKNIARPVRIYRLRAVASEGGGDVSTTANTSFDDRRAIAVLPFANFSGDPEQEFFADGITEDVIAMLAGWRAFPVIARNSTFIYKGQTIDVKKVGQELGVRYVLEGSVRKSGRRVRVTAQLIQTDSGHHIMAERYDRELVDLFELQDEIVTAIAGAIEPELLKFERDRIAERPQQSEDAYELYQHGVWYQHRYTADDHHEAQRLFRAALAIDPDYPQATAALAQVLCNAGFLNWSDDPKCCYEESFALAQRAVALDSRYPQAHFVLGLICVWTSRSDRAILALQEAIKLNPSFAAAYILLGQTFIYQGEAEKAVPLIEKAIRFSPTDPRMFVSLTALAGAHYQRCEYERAVEIGQRAWAINRNWPGGLRYIIAGLAQLGRAAEAQAMLPELKRLNRNLSFIEGNLTRLYGAKNRAGVEHILDGLRKAGFE
jgi:adenylate cyclase